MTNKIGCLKDLHAERSYLRAQIKDMEIRIKEDIHAIETRVKPVVHDMFQEQPIAQPNVKSMLVTASVGLGLDFVVTQLIMRHSSGFKKAVVSWVIQNGMPLVAGTQARRIFSSLLHRRNRLSNNE